MLPSFSYLRAGSRREALEALAAPGARAHAGGTDLLGCLRDGVFSADTLVSLSALSELRGIRQRADGGIVLGALTPIAQVAASGLVRRRHPGLAQAAAAVASPQLRNQGTLGGNLCQRPRCWYFRGDFHCAKKGGDVCYAVAGENRYHALFGGGPCYIVHPSDTAPMLLALGASVRLEGPEGERTVPVEELFVLPADELYQETVLRQGELVTAVEVPPPAAGQRSSYRKVRERGAWDFALVSVALALAQREGRVTAARVAFGGVAPVPWRARAVEEVLVGQPLTATTARAAAEAAVQGAEPLADNGYKVPLLRGAVEESLMAV